MRQVNQAANAQADSLPSVILSQNPSSAMTGKTILVADDQEIVRSYVGSILSRAGCRVIQAADGLDALKQVSDAPEPIDLLLTDIRMPRMDGITLARSIIERFPNTPVLYISGYSFDLREEGSGMPSTAFSFLAKPFSRQALIDAVRKLLDEGQSRHGLPAKF